GRRDVRHAGHLSINVSDGHGGVTAIPVTVSISPKNTNPTVNFGTPLKLVGVATYIPPTATPTVTP
ncbi:MAG TPA: hypothetical protein VE666_17930, partial [Mycobacterium sp.]|nr:hypothetical protein [Mycobacterium sp.]